MEIFYTKMAERQLAALSKTAQIRIANKMRFYAKQNDPLQYAKKLSGYDLFRFRIGEYRIIFEVQYKKLFILMILRRDSAYKNLS